MNLKTTFTLFVLAGASVFLWWYGNLPLPMALDPAARPASVEDKGTREFLHSLSRDKIQRIVIHAPSGDTELTHKADGQWHLPGNWPIRRHEVDNLVGLLTSLRSRFQPQPIHEDKDLQAFGLDHSPVSATIRTEGEEHTLSFGEQRADSLDNRFSRDTYVRLDKKPEVVRLAPGLIAALDKPTDYYQERRLFEKETIAGDTPRDSAEQLRANRLTVEDKKKDGTHFTLVRSGRDWKEAELAEPVRDRLDDATRKALLAGVFDLWAEKFFAPKSDLLERSGLTKPERIITAKTDKGDAVTLLIGAVSSSRQRMVPAPQPRGMFPGMQQQQRMMPVTEEYRYAKLKDNEQIFEIKADKLKDVFVALDKLRDNRIAHFNSSDARRVEIAHGVENIVLEKDKENWKLIKPVSAEADNTKVTDLLTKIADLQARDKDVIDKGDPKKYGFDKPEAVVKITVEEEVQSGEKKEKKTRTLTVQIGKHDADKKKLYVKTDDWPRINVVDDSLAPLVQRSAMAYRGKRLLDFNAADVAKIDIENGGKPLALVRSGASRGSEEGAWRLAQPVKADADAGKVERLLGDLGRLEATEFIAQEPKPAELEAQYGLGKSALKARIEFSDKRKPAKELLIGKARGGKGGYFARMADGGPVFAIGEDLHKQLVGDSLSYRPQTLWQMIPEEIEWLTVQKAGQKEYKLTRAEKEWKISGPFEANALSAGVQKMIAALVAPKVESYTAHEAKNLAEYGLDKPEWTVRIKAVLDKDDKNHTLLIGKPVREGGERYAKRGNDSAIFTVSDAFVRSTDRTALDLLDTRLLHLDAAKIERMRSQAGDKSLTLERGKEKSAWQVTQSPAGAFSADAEASTSLSQLCSDLRAERFADYGKGVDWSKYGLDKPAVRVTVQEGKAEHVIELGKQVAGKSGQRFARVDKGSGAAILPSDTSRILERVYLDYVPHDLLKFDSASATLLQRRMGTKNLEIAKKGDDWNVVGPANQKADSQTMQQLFEQLGHLRAERIAAYPAKDLKPFGLDAPAAVIKIELKPDQKPSEHVIKLGKPAADKDRADAGSTARFALVDDSKSIAVLSGSLVERLAGSPIAFRDRTLVRFGDADRLELKRGPRQAVFRKIDGTWKLTEPLQGDAEQDRLDDFLVRLSRLRAAALVAEKPDADAMKKYGLDRPEAQWRVQSGDKEVLNLFIGNKETNGERRYARLDKGGLVFLLDPGLSQKALDEYRPRTVWTPPLDAVEIESLNYRYSRAPFLLEKVGSTWQAVGKKDAKINAATVEDTLAALAGLKLSRYAVDKDANPTLFGLDKPELVLEIATRSGKRVLQIGNAAGSTKGRYARVANGDGVFVLDEETCGRLLRDLAVFGRPPARSPLQPVAR